MITYVYVFEDWQLNSAQNIDGLDIVAIYIQPHQPWKVNVRDISDNAFAFAVICVIIHLLHGYNMETLHSSTIGQYCGTLFYCHFPCSEFDRKYVVAELPHSCRAAWL